MSGVSKETGIWSLKIAKRHKCDFLLAGAIGSIYEPKSIADIGCGNGRYCSVFKAFGWKLVDGYEGTKGISDLGVYSNITEIDLTKQLDAPRKYDLVICLEVAEHIPRKYEQVFIDNLCKFIKKDLVISWARKGQPSASGHFNTRNKDYVILKFNEKGLNVDREKTEFLERHSSFDWFKNNIIAFYV
jgi:2-polyprenyl-3-methyl-5-hydroxy-6-metoxy-1,4-benzoquinol methylase